MIKVTWLAAPSGKRGTGGPRQGSWLSPHAIYPRDTSGVGRASGISCPGGCGATSQKHQCPGAPSGLGTDFATHPPPISMAQRPQHCRDGTLQERVSLPMGALVTPCLGSHSPNLTLASSIVGWEALGSISLRSRSVLLGFIPMNRDGPGLSLGWVDIS